MTDRRSAFYDYLGPKPETERLSVCARAAIEHVWGEHPEPTMYCPLCDTAGEMAADALDDGADYPADFRAATPLVERWDQPRHWRILHEADGPRIVRVNPPEEL